MKKGIILATIIFLVLVILSGCDSYASRYPAYYTRWIAREVDMYFVVDAYEGISGVLSHQDKETEVGISFDHGRFILFQTTVTVEPWQILTGPCDFYTDKFRVYNISVNNPELFDSTIKKITFVRDKNYTGET